VCCCTKTDPNITSSFSPKLPALNSIKAFVFLCNMHNFSHFSFVFSSLFYPRPTLPYKNTSETNNSQKDTKKPGNKLLFCNTFIGYKGGLRLCANASSCDILTLRQFLVSPDSFRKSAGVTLKCTSYFKRGYKDKRNKHTIYTKRVKSHHPHIYTNNHTLVSVSNAINFPTHHHHHHLAYCCNRYTYHQ
jgi:hypothetical protein